MANIIQWVATATTILAALVTASNLGTRVTGYGFVIFLLGSICWVASGLMLGQSPVVWNNAILTVLNILGIWRWLGRQAQVEEGADNARRRSHASPGEDLFPVSLLTKGKVVGGVTGHCVDAMAGFPGGQIRYVVVSDGGAAGVGESLYRADWREVIVGDGQLEVKVPIGSLPKVKRDSWPGR
jgi:hypothetical protein